MRYRSLARNALQLQLLALALDLRRALVLCPLRAESASNLAATAVRPRQVPAAA